MVGRVYAAAIGRCSRDVRFGACAHRHRPGVGLDATHPSYSRDLRPDVPLESITLAYVRNLLDEKTGGGVSMVGSRAALYAAVLLASTLIAVLVPFATVDAADPVFVGAGDIASCSRTQDEATAKLLDAITGVVFTAGDNAYEKGTATEYATCYGPTWGRHKSRTRPVPGNHEYETPGALGYYGYFGSLAGDPAKGYYSFDIGAWHAVMLNSNCSSVGGCGATSAQNRWLGSDLDTHPSACTIAVWHHPRFTSTRSTPDGLTLPLWKTLYDHGAEIIINGHRHQYERFAAQTPDGTASPDGIREFVVGTGGISLVGFSGVMRNSQVRNSKTFGVLKLTLHSSSYDFSFIPIAGQTFRDSGSGDCHGKPST